MLRTSSQRRSMGELCLSVLLLSSSVLLEAMIDEVLVLLVVYG